MAKITGFGGAFVRVDDPKALYAWYEKHLGLTSQGFIEFPAEQQRASISVAFFPRTSTYYPEAQPAMLNFQVDDVAGLLDRLASEGVKVDPKREEHEYGKFGWFYDLEGNRIELWQPNE